MKAIKKIYRKFMFFWVSNAPHNVLRIYSLKLMGFKVGKSVVMSNNVSLIPFMAHNWRLVIGDRAAIGQGVTIVVVSHPNYSKLKKIFGTKTGNVHIGNDSWIGVNVTILPGVTIGECSVVNSGAVVTKDVEPYTIVGGVPAKLIRRIDQLNEDSYKQYDAQ